MDYPWTIHGLSMAYLWLLYGVIPDRKSIEFDERTVGIFEPSPMRNKTPKTLVAAFPC